MNTDRQMPRKVSEYENVRFPSTTPWLRRARWAVGLGAIACVPVGLSWVYNSAIQRDIAGAIAGAGLCLGVLALEFMAGSLLRMGGMVLRSVRRIESMETRLTDLETAIAELDDSIIQTTDLTTAGDRAHELIAGYTDRPPFPRLATPTDGEADRQQLAKPPIRGTATTLLDSQHQLDALVQAEMEELRSDFATRFRQGDFAGAVRIGERIVTLFPDSVLADEFKRIRVHLLRRADSESPDKPASAM